LNKAVLFLTFNRLDTTQKVFEQIKIAQPPRLYLASDGPRQSKSGESEQVQEVRKWILDNIDWDCEVKTLFRDENLGCGKAVSSAITWFFEQEEDGIILEDDCLPNQSFFKFCQEMLDKYKDDNRIMHMCGCNLQFGQKRGDGSYYFSKIAGCWGWASWRKTWQLYDYEMKTLDKFIQSNYIQNIYENKVVQDFWIENFELTKNGIIKTWDYQMVYAMFLNNGLSIIPNTNLIKNIGFIENSTHTGDLESPCANLQTFDLAEEIIHPEFVLYSKDADDYIYEEIFKISLKSIKNKSFGRIIIDKIRGKK